MKGAEAMRAFEPDWIVAMGGGSPIDAAKAMWAFYEYPDVTFEDLCIPFNFPELRQKAKFAAIPSTSGTATEVTAFSVITDYAKGIKYPLADFNITPDVAIVDSELVEGLPAHQVAYTGMDALTHAIEAYVSTLNCAYTDPLAIQAIEMVFDYLPASYKGNMDARAHMHDAQCLAGMAFSNALLGIVHSMAHKTGAAFSTGHITHGLANAMYLPYVIKYNAKDPVAAKRYAEIARRVGLEGASEKALINSLCKKIDDFNVILGIPATLKEFGIKEDEFKEKIASMQSLQLAMPVQVLIHVQLIRLLWKTIYMRLLWNRSRLLEVIYIYLQKAGVLCTRFLSSIIESEAKLRIPLEIFKVLLYHSEV